jgi:hypothetical protein
MHCSPDFNTKKAMLEYFKKGGTIEVYSPGIFPLSPTGTGVIEAPSHYHKHYTRVEYVNFIVTKILRD